MTTEITTTDTARDAGQITTWFTGYPSNFATGYDAALCFTNKAARHFAVDTNAKSARAAQRKFAGFANRLLRLLAREFPTAQIQIAGETQSPEMRKAVTARHARFSFAVWLTDGNRITRCFAIVGDGYGYESVMVEQTTYPHQKCDAALGRTEIKTDSAHTMATPALRLIVATPFSVYAA